MKFIGVDGCKIGWFYTAINHENDWDIGVSENIEKLWETHKDASLILIDIPVGLPFKNPRACDLKARKLLGKGKTSCVFPPPCREALAAETYEAACEINKNKLGKKINWQTWNISKKIKEVDDFLIENHDARRNIRETHPEICFWALAGGRAMLISKKNKHGFEERLDLLKKVFPLAESIVDAAMKKFLRKYVAKDDILDSIAAGLIACSPVNSLSTVPKIPGKDAKGLPMEMVFSNRNLIYKIKNNSVIERITSKRYSPLSKIYIPSTKPEDWQSLLADPEKHWRKGYSARALAFCWQEANGFPACVNRAFKKSDIDLFQNMEVLLAIPEYKVSLPGGPRSSQNDLFVLAKSNDELISIAVEGKVSEPFGDTVSKWLQNPTRGRKKRLGFLCAELGLAGADVSNIRYQLLHRTASAILEAKKFNAANALMLVHSFSQKDEWFEDFFLFSALFGIDAKINRIHSASKIGDIQLYLGWVKGDPKYLEK